MKLFENPLRHVATEVDIISDPPAGGMVKLILLGIFLPMVIGYFGMHAWMTQEARWIGRGMSMNVFGAEARALGFAYLSGALFCHFRWFWGLLPNGRVYEIGTVASLIGFVAGLGYGMYLLLVY